jgi:hypothetical protein
MPHNVCCPHERRNANMRLGNVVYCSLLTVLLGLGCTLKAARAELQGASQVCTGHYQAVPQPAMDAKTAIAARIQQERKKAEVSSAVSDFEKSLNNSNLSQCDRRLNNSVELWSNGVRANSCRDLFCARERADGVANAKPKLRNEGVELTYPEARVTLDSSNEHHTYLLEDVHDQWLIRCFVSKDNKEMSTTTSK